MRASSIVWAFAAGILLFAGCGKSGQEAEQEALVARKAKIAEAKKAKAEALAKRRADRVREQSKVRAAALKARGDLSEAAWLAERARLVKDTLALVRDIEEEDKQKPPRWLTKAQALRQILDLGDEAKALSMAREMRHSSRRSDRAGAVEAFSWLGDKAIADLTVMMADAEADIASDALTAWQQGIEGLEDESLRGELILEAARLVSNEGDMDTILMEVTTFESPKEAIRTLDLVINDAQTTASAKECARETFEHVGGEEYSNTARATAIGDQLERETTETNLKALEWFYKRRGLPMPSGDSTLSPVAL